MAMSSRPVIVLSQISQAYGRRTGVYISTWYDMITLLCPRSPRGRLSFPEYRYYRDLISDSTFLGFLLQSLVTEVFRLFSILLSAFCCKVASIVSCWFGSSSPARTRLQGNCPIHHNHYLARLRVSELVSR